MSSPRWILPMRRVSFPSILAIFAAAFASAQSSPSPSLFSSSLSGVSEASSNPSPLATGDGYGVEAGLAAASAGGAGGGAGQLKHGWKSLASHGLAFDLGAGFNAPIGNDTSSAGSGPFNGPFITWGGNFTAGGGLRFSKRVSLLGEFQFIDDKLPGSFIAYEGGQQGNSHIVSLTADPMIDLFPKRTTSVYATGGGGYYHKSTNFNVFGGYDYFGDPVFITANSFSSNQFGGNLGFGVTHRIGGVYGDGTMKLFAEARYLYIHTPPLSQSNGLGPTELIPVTFGVRW